MPKQTDLTQWMAEATSSPFAKRDRLQRSPEEEQKEKQRRTDSTPLDKEEPQMSQILQLLLAIQSDVQDVKDEQAKMRSEQTVLCETIASLPEWKKQMERDKEDQDRKIENQREEIVTLKNEVENLKSKLSRMEQQEVRRNIIVSGVEETAREGEIGTVAHLREKLEDKIGFTQESVEEGFRLGRKTEGKTRPILVKFKSFEDKAKIMKMKSNLKNSHYYINHDFTDEVRINRRKLLTWSRRAREEGKRTYLVRDKLFINGKPYRMSIEEGEERLVACDFPKND